MVETPGSPAFIAFIPSMVSMPSRLLSSMPVRSDVTGRGVQPERDVRQSEDGRDAGEPRLYRLYPLDGLYAVASALFHAGEIGRGGPRGSTRKRRSTIRGWSRRRGAPPLSPLSPRWSLCRRVCSLPCR